MRITDKRLVSFATSEAEAQEEGPATFAQQHAWLALQELHPHEHVSNRARMVKPSYPLTLAELEHQLAELFTELPILRTRLSKTEDGELRQHVSHHGVVSLDIADIESDDMSALRQGLLSKVFRPEVDWPLRATAILDDEHVSLVVLVFSHLLFDGSSVQRVADAFIDLLEGGETGIVGHSSLGQARLEQAAWASRAASRSVAYWESQIETYAACTMQAAPSSRERLRQPFRLRSGPLALAVRSIASRSGLTEPAVALGALACALALAFHKESVGFLLVVNNRTSAQAQDYIGILNQDVLINLDASGDSLETVCRRALVAGLKAHRVGSFAPAQIASLIKDAEVRHKTAFDFPVLNVRWSEYVSSRHAARYVGPGVNGLSVERSLLAGLATNAGYRGLNIEFELSPNCVDIQLVAAADCMSQSEASQLLLDVESVLLAAVKNGTGHIVAPGSPDAKWANRERNL